MQEYLPFPSFRPLSEILAEWPPDEVRCEAARLTALSVACSRTCRTLLGLRRERCRGLTTRTRRSGRWRCCTGSTRHAAVAAVISVLTAGTDAVHDPECA